MEFINFVKQEIAVIKDRDPAIKSTMEVFLYPSFKAILKYRKDLFVIKKEQKCTVCVKVSLKKWQKKQMLSISWINWYW